MSDLLEDDMQLLAVAVAVVVTKRLDTNGTMVLPSLIADSLSRGGVPDADVERFKDEFRSRMIQVAKRDGG